MLQSMFTVIAWLVLSTLLFLKKESEILAVPSVRPSVRTDKSTLVGYLFEAAPWH